MRYEMAARALSERRTKLFKQTESGCWQTPLMKKTRTLSHKLVHKFRCLQHCTNPHCADFYSQIVQSIAVEAMLFDNKQQRFQTARRHKEGEIVTIGYILLSAVRVFFPRV